MALPRHDNSIEWISSKALRNSAREFLKGTLDVKSLWAESATGTRWREGREVTVSHFSAEEEAGECISREEISVPRDCFRGIIRDMSARDRAHGSDFTSSGRSESSNAKDIFRIPDTLEPSVQLNYPAVAIAPETFFTYDKLLIHGGAIDAIRVGPEGGSGYCLSATLLPGEKGVRVSVREGSGRSVAQIYVPLPDMPEHLSDDGVLGWLRKAIEQITSA